MVNRTRYRNELGQIDAVGAFHVVQLYQNIMPVMSSTTDQTNKALVGIAGVNVTVSNSGYYNTEYQPRQMYRGSNTTEKCNVVQVSGTTTSNYTDSTYSARTQAMFSSPIAIYSVSYSSRNGTHNVVPVDIKFQVSSDGTTWTDVYSDTWSAIGLNSSRNTVINNPVPGTYFRLYFTKKYCAQGADTHGITIGGLQFNALA